MQRLALNLFIFGALLVAVPTHAQANKDKIDAGSSELSRIMGGDDPTVRFDLTDDASAIENVNAGLSDAALVTGSLDALIKETNQGSPDPLKKSDLKAEKVGEIALSFVVNKNNPVQRLSKKQIKDIFSGKVTNWQALGGPNPCAFSLWRLITYPFIEGFCDIAVCVFKLEPVHNSSPSRSTALSCVSQSSKM